MMANPFIRWLLALDSVPTGATGLRLAWEHPLSLWIWLLVCVVAAVVAWGSYRGVAIAPTRRKVLIAVRTLVIMLLVVLLVGPLLELPQEVVEPDSVIVLADRSRSMEVEDVATSNGNFVSRDRALQSLLSPGNPLDGVGKEHRVTWYGFSEALVSLPKSDTQALSLGEAVGDRSLLSQSIEQAITQSGGRAISSIILLTDGRTDNPPDRALLRRLQAEGISLSAVAFGSEAKVGDGSITEVQAPRRAFSKDIVPVLATIERRGQARERAARVDLVDTATGAVLDHADLPGAVNINGDVSRNSVQLVARPTTAGEARWEVRLVDLSVVRDLIPANDRRAVSVALVDRPIKVLYVEGYPRWEYRYLKNLLQREGTIDSSVMLLSADRDFAQEGNTPIARLPRTREEFESFDLIILGDLPASFFTGEQLTEMRRAVSERGAGILWIGGSRNTPRSWAGTSMEELIPFVGPYELERLPVPVNLLPTTLATRLGVLCLADDPKAPFPNELLSADDGWAQLEWAQRIPANTLKPSTEVFANTLQEIEGQHAPLVVGMRYGAGNVLYVATDEIWRWRNGRGETYPERFWVQFLRALARPSLGVNQEQVRIAIDPGRATIGDTVRVEVELPQKLSNQAIVIEAVSDDNRTAVVDIEVALSSGGNYFGVWSPPEIGHWKFRPRDPSLAARIGDESTLEVVRSDRELRDAEADRPLLETLAKETGGRVVGPADFANLVKNLPNRSVRTENPVQDQLWNSPLALISLLALLLTEWIVRRSVRLV